jgi:hypothetical protein
MPGMAATQGRLRRRRAGWPDCASGHESLLSFCEGPAAGAQLPVLGNEKSELSGRNCGSVVLRSVSP